MVSSLNQLQTFMVNGWYVHSYIVIFGFLQPLNFIYLSIRLLTITLKWSVILVIKLQHSVEVQPNLKSIMLYLHFVCSFGSEIYLNIYVTVKKLYELRCCFLKINQCSSSKKESCNEVHRLVLLDIIYATNNIMDIGIWTFLKAQIN